MSLDYLKKERFAFVERGPFEQANLLEVAVGMLKHKHALERLESVKINTAKLK